MLTSLSDSMYTDLMDAMVKQFDPKEPSVPILPPPVIPPPSGTDIASTPVDGRNIQAEPHKESDFNKAFRDWVYKNKTRDLYSTRGYILLSPEMAETPRKDNKP